MYFGVKDEGNGVYSEVKYGLMCKVNIYGSKLWIQKNHSA